MDFAAIRSLEDVEPFISFERGFVVSRRADHTVVDYVYAVPETFSCGVSLECRGLKFDRSGRIIGRPFHKFFNIGERERIEDTDWSAPHGLLAKLDGSMIHPVILDGRLAFMTRKGESAQAIMARHHAEPGTLDLSRFLIEGGITPIFEFTSPDNRVVVAYDSPALTLLAAREMVSGRYLPRAEIVRLGERFGVPVVVEVDPIADAAAFIAQARREAGIEGYVVCFESGHRLKLKTDGYVLRHRAIAGIHLEKNVLAWVATQAVDDVVAILPPDIAARVLAYQAAVNAGIAAHAGAIADFAAEHRDLPRKEFAALALSRFDRRLTGAVFAAFDGRDPARVIVDMLAQAAKSDPKVDAIRDLFALTWSVEGLALPELET
ncbi:RNA ligase [Methylobacterium oryzihabitans]|uniref:RNA ligase n=1 Tax=Methylobacterium oryzihabitans TaxID=2499852 RepID=UPI0016522185|nr:RNA ligase [Methylobacterium oryzihabitans]